MPAKLRSQYQTQRLSTAGALIPPGEGLIYRYILENAQSGQPARAEYLLWLASGFSPQNHILHAWRATFKWARDDLAGAEHLCEKAIRRFPQQAYLRWLMAIFLEENSDAGRVLSVLGDETPGLEPPPVILLRVALHRKRGDLETGIAIAKTARRFYPDTPLAAQLLARTLISYGDLAEGQRVAEQAHAQFPGRAVFSDILATLALRHGKNVLASRFAIDTLEKSPGRHVTMRILLNCVSNQPDLFESAKSRFDAYQQRALKRAAKFSVLRRISDFTGEDPDIRAVQKIANADSGASFDTLLASAAVDDFARAAEILRHFLGSPILDQRLIAFLRIYAGRVEPFMNWQHSPGIAQLEGRLQDLALSAPVPPALKLTLQAFTKRVTEPPPPDCDQVLVSLICPVHRPGDVQNILSQLRRQRWPNLELIICLSGADISQSVIESGIAAGVRRQIFHCSPGKPVGYYLNRCIEKASGDYLLRFDADDHYDPDYIYYMLGFMFRDKADVISMDLSSYYFSDIDQTYAIRRPRPHSIEGMVDNAQATVGSGSSMCARAKVFETLSFSESLSTGEDASFYRQALACGLNVLLVPNYFHTATRQNNSQSHTWKIDDFNLLTADARYLGEGCIIPRPEATGLNRTDTDQGSDLFSHPDLCWMRELDMQSVLRSMLVPVRLVIGCCTPIPERDTPYLTVTRDSTVAAGNAGSTWVFIPEEPIHEQELAVRLGASSVSWDIIPELVSGNREVFATDNPVKPVSQRALSRSFKRSRYRYVILSNPRSGSEFLCSLLASMGMGRPGELLREPIAKLLSRGLSAGEYLQNVLARQLSDDTLGTKIVSQYLFRYLGDDQLSEILAWMLRNSFRFIRLRREEQASSVSDYIAQKRGVWHQYYQSGAPGSTGSLEERLSNIPAYDFEGIAHNMKNHLAWSSALDALLEANVPGNRLLQLNYTEISSEPALAVDKIADFIGFALLPGAIPVAGTRALSADNARVEMLRTRFNREWAQHMQRPQRPANG